MITRALLKQRQSLPLAQKVMMAERRIREFYDKMDGDVFISFSGGVDSRVLVHLVRSLYPRVPAVFADTGLEYPEIREFVKTFENVEWVRPAKSFRRVLEDHGYPVVSKEVSQKIYEVRTTKSDKLRHKRLHGDTNKYRSGKIPEKWKFLVDAPFKIGHQCCDVMKKRPMARYEKRTGHKPYIGTMAAESHARTQVYLRKGGCNSFEGKIYSQPLSCWNSDDTWEYIRTRELSYSRIYDMGADRTGCMFCMFGVHREDEPNRFQRMKETHPKLWSYCMDKLGLRDVLAYLKVPSGGEK